MEKPDTVFGRDQEWRVLQRFLRVQTTADLNLGIVSGRRRAGKTHLLRAVCDEVGGLYHACVQDEGDIAARRRFAASVSAHAGIDLPRSEPGSWEQLLRTALSTAARTAPTGRAPLVVIDEFPYAMVHAPQLPGLIQLLFDQAQRGEAGGGRLILCGSAFSVMRDLLSGTKALRGRAMMDLRLGPLDYRLAAKLWSIDDPEAALRVHACVGGYPGYRRLIPDVPANLGEFDDWVTQNLLSVGIGVFSHTEVEYLLREDPRITDHVGYYDVLSAITEGANSLSKIGSAVGKSKEAVRHIIATLRSGGYVTSVQDLLRNKSTVSVVDPIIRFDRLIAAPRFGQLELGEAENAWSHAAASFRSGILGPHFEDLAREWVYRFAPGEMNRNGGFGEIGSANVHDHARRARHEIDVVAKQGNAITFVGEAKATMHQRGLSDLERLDGLRALLSQLGYETGETVLGVFSRTGFTGDLVRTTANRPDLELVDLDRLYGHAPRET